MMKKITGLESIILLLYLSKKNKMDGIRGLTRLEKLLFLLEKERHFSIEGYHFEADRFGPLEMKVYDDLETLEQMGFITKQSAETFDTIEYKDIQFHDSKEYDIKIKPEKYLLTLKGQILAKKIFNSLTKSEREAFNEIILKFNTLTLTEILRYIYTKFEEFARNSQIKNQILNSNFGTIKINNLEEE